MVLHLVDLFDSNEKDKNLKKIARITKKKDQGQRREVKVIVCGGDGTVLWVVELVAHSGISTEKVIFGIIPIGTGNDFSRCLKWGGSPISFD